MSQVAVITGRDRRRKWGSEERRRVLEAVFAPGAVIAHVARQFDVATSMIYEWRHKALAAHLVKYEGNTTLDRQVVVA